MARLMPGNKILLQNEEERKSNIELLRIICMFLIIAGHLTWQSGIMEQNGMVFNKGIAVFLGSASGIADNVFVMISAWFLVGKKFKGERILRVYFQVFLYCIPITCLMLCFFPDYVEIKDLIRGVFPYSGSPLWFATCYISMLLFMPFMNVLLDDRNKTKVLLLLLFIINSVPSTFLFRDDFFYSGELVWFCFLYMFVGYIRKYNFSIRANHCIFLLCACIIYLILIGMFFIVEYISTKNSIINSLNSTINLSTYFIKRFHTIPSFVCSIMLFMYFKELKMQKSRKINVLATGCFGVYIFHQTPAFAKYMWFELFKVEHWLYSRYYVFYYLGTILLIFIIGSILDYIRRKIFVLLISKRNFYKASCNIIEKLYYSFY